MNQQPRWRKVLLFVQMGIVFFLFWPVCFNTYTPVSFILTDSMTPALPPGTMIFVRHDPAQGLAQYKNQPIVFYDPIKKMSICHRVVGVEGDRLVTKGDNNSFADAFQPGAENIIGRVVFALPKKVVLGFVLLAVSAILGVLLGRWRNRK